MKLPLVIALCAALAGCAAATDAPPAPNAAPHTSRLAWPAPPQPARVVYLSGFRSPAELGYRESLGNAFKDFLGGGEFQGMMRPYAVAANDTMLVVADPGLSAVHIFTHRRKRYTLLNAAGNTALGSPVGVALGADRIYVADSALNRVFVLNGRQRLLREIDGFERPTSLAYDPDGEQLYVADTHAHTIRQYDRDGLFVRELGERGNADGQFNYPTHLSVAGKRLFVNDTLNFRIQVFALPSGRHAASFGKHGDRAGYFAQPKGIVATPDGIVFVTEAVFGQVQIFNVQGEFLLGFGGPGEGPGEFQLPAGLAMWNERIYVADAGNRRIQVFEYVVQE